MIHASRKSPTLSKLRINHEIVEQPGDGDCFYHAVAYFYNDKTGQDFRTLVVQHLQSMNSESGHFSVLKDDVEDGKFADNIEIFLLQQLLSSKASVCFIIVDDDRESLTTIGSVIADSMALLHLSQEHYSSIHLASKVDEAKIRKRLASKICFQLPFYLRKTFVRRVWCFMIASVLYIFRNAFLEAVGVFLL